MLRNIFWLIIATIIAALALFGLVMKVLAILMMVIAWVL